MSGADEHEEEEFLRAVLVVDDEPAVRETACDLFRSFGLQSFDAYNAADALRLLSSHPEIGLLFADVRMPVMDGAQLAREARRIRPDLKIVLTSGWVDDVPVAEFPLVRKPLGRGVIAGLMRAMGIRPRRPAHSS
jgi:CheY-like chemotaxis protein